MAMKPTPHGSIRAAVARAAQPGAWLGSVRNSFVSGEIPLAIGRAFPYTGFNIAATPLHDALPRWLFYCPSSWRAK